MNHSTHRLNQALSLAVLMLASVAIGQHSFAQPNIDSAEPRADSTGLWTSGKPAMNSPKNFKTLQQIRDMGGLDTGLRPLVAGNNGDSLGPAVSPRDLAYGKVRRLKQKLTSGVDRKTIAPQLQSALAEYFIADMRHRVHELDAIKAKVAETEAKLMERLRAQEAVVDLQLEVMLSEANGLGFPHAPTDVDEFTVPLQDKKSVAHHGKLDANPIVPVEPTDVDKFTAPLQDKKSAAHRGTPNITGPGIPAPNPIVPVESKP